MGGRSREREIKKGEGDAFSFVSELSDSRLNAYGQYSSMGFQNLDTPTRTETGIPVNHLGLNQAASAEYEKRHGSVPIWGIDDESVKHRRKKMGFKDA